MSTLSSVILVIVVIAAIVGIGYAGNYISKKNAVVTPTVKVEPKAPTVADVPAPVKKVAAKPAPKAAKKPTK